MTAPFNCQALKSTDCPEMLYSSIHCSSLSMNGSVAVRNLGAGWNMISLITISRWNENSFAAPGVSRDGYDQGASGLGTTRARVRVCTATASSNPPSGPRRKGGRDLARKSRPG